MKTIIRSVDCAAFFLLLLFTSARREEPAMNDTFVNDTFAVDTRASFEYDPLTKHEEENLTEWEEEADSDTEDMPMLPNMPEGAIPHGVFDASNYEDPTDAIRALLEKNPGRRPVYLSIIELCETGCTSSELTLSVDTMQAENQSVYGPMTLCHALERAGALEIDRGEEIKDSASTGDANTGDSGYLVVDSQVDPIWTSTKSGIRVLKDERGGRAYKQLFEVDGDYLFMYQEVLEFLSESPRTKAEIDALVDDDPRVQSPRRYSNHFIEYLESADALVWKNRQWTITPLGQVALEDLKSRSEEN